MKTVALISMIFAMATSNAVAMLCKPREPQQIAAAGEIAFVGTVASVADSPYSPPVCERRTAQSPQCGGRLVTFHVTESLRGEIGSEITAIAEDSCSCLSPYWSVGSSYLVIARKNSTNLPGALITGNICEGTSIVNELTPQIIRAIRGGK